MPSTGERLKSLRGVASTPRFPTLLLLALGAQPVLGAPISLHPDVSLRPVMVVESNAVRIAKHPTEDRLYYLRRNGQIYEVDIGDSTSTLLFSSADHGLSATLGLEIGPDSTFYIVGNTWQDSTTVATIRRASPPGYSWVTVAETVPYPRSDTNFDHLMNGIVLNPAGDSLFVNSGSRTDHGEVQENAGRYPGLREIPLTSVILRIPADASNLTLQNDQDSLAAAGYFYADGVRNTFDLAFTPGQDLIGCENSGDRDDGEELNWIREGHHYGFPWRMGTNDTPQQFPGYDPDTDLLVNQGASSAYADGFFHNDPTYPPPPPGIFTDPVSNTGPHADRFRDPSDGSIQDASDLSIFQGTFTPHKSPLGLVFDTESVLRSDFAGDGFVLGWTDSSSSLLGPFGDTGEDLLHLDFTKIPEEERYEITATRLVSGFANPIDAVMCGNRIYVLEFSFSSQVMIWEVMLPVPSVGVPEPSPSASGFVLHPVSPNPFTPPATVSYRLPVASQIEVSIYDISGRRIRTLRNAAEPAGERSIVWDGRDDRGRSVAGGAYFIRLIARPKDGPGQPVVMRQRVVRLP